MTANLAFASKALAAGFVFPTANGAHTVLRGGDER
ncbi:UNVERIFIED_ORG: hypothetical protein J2W85_007133 [Ensifer adhaerens]|nr:hypothetical protein [Ensifer adhaerens]